MIDKDTKNIFKDFTILIFALEAINLYRSINIEVTKSIKTEYLNKLKNKNRK